MSSVGYLDGVLAPVDELSLGVRDHGITVGDGVFETIPVRHGRPFALGRHLARLARSAAGLGLGSPEAAVLRDAVEAVVEANPDHDRIRLTVTGGASPPGSERGPGPPTVLVLSGMAAPVEPTTEVVVTEWSRHTSDPLCGLKTTSYAGNVRALAFAHERGASEGLFTAADGSVCEGTGSNVFAVIDGALVTPPLSGGCLAGVTRALIMEITEATEATFDPARLRGAPEAFLTSSVRDVQAIARVDGHPLGAAPGPVTTAAAEALADLMARDPDP